MTVGSAAALLGCALVWDASLGELPNRAHPVAWFGRIATALRARLPTRPALRAVSAGVALVAVGLGLVGLVFVVDRLLRHPWPWLADALGLFWLQASFAARGLLDAARVVERSLRAGDLNAARRGLSALCSRDPAQLDEEQVAGAAASSLAENLADSVVAPLVYFALFGLAGALVFRVVNTLDAMVGYRGRYEWLGKPAARLDDLLGWVPARLTVIALLASACALRLPVRAGLRAWRRDGRLTPSPNGGQPMATLAGTLGVRLHKPESYTLLPEGRRPGAETLAQARSLVGVAMVVAGLVSLGLVWCSGPARGLWDPAGAPW